MQYLRCFLGGGAVTLLVTDRFFNIVKVEGVSMQPTLNPSGRWDERDIVLVDKRKCMTYDFERGDVVTIDLHPNKRIVKRIVGLGGDWIRSNRKDSEEEGSWDGEKKVHSSVVKDPAGDLVPIPAGYCWVEGDSPAPSEDSNSFGPIPLGVVTGTVEYCVYPFSRFGKKIVRKTPNDKKLFIKIDDYR